MASVAHSVHAKHGPVTENGGRVGLLNVCSGRYGGPMRLTPARRADDTKRRRDERYRADDVERRLGDIARRCATGDHGPAAGGASWPAVRSTGVVYVVSPSARTLSRSVIRTSSPQSVHT